MNQLQRFVNRARQSVRSARRTNLEILGTSGGTVEAGRGVLTAGGGELVVRVFDQKTRRIARLKGFGLAAAAGWSMPGPRAIRNPETLLADVTVSTDESPSSGSQLRFGPAGSAEMTAPQLAGPVLLHMISASAIRHQSSGLIYFLTPPKEPFALEDLLLVPRIKAVGTFQAEAVSNSIALDLGVQGFDCRLVSLSEPVPTMANPETF